MLPSKQSRFIILRVYLEGSISRRYMSGFFAFYGTFGENLCMKFICDADCNFIPKFYFKFLLTKKIARNIIEINQRNQYNQCKNAPQIKGGMLSCKAAIG